MAFAKKTWVARQGTNLNRFTDSLTASVMILDNTPTAVTTLGDSFTADNMNELEIRIDDALQNIDAESITVANGIESSFLKTGLITSTSEIDAIDLYAESITIEKAGSTGSVKIAIVDGNAGVAVNGQIETGHITAGGIFVTGEPSGQGVISMGDNHLGNTTATAVTADTATIGALNVNGNIVQNGSAYETHAEQVYTKDDKIILRDGAVAGLTAGQYAGFTAKMYDGTNDGNFVFDKDGIARVGDVGTEQPLATREETPIDNGIALWDSVAQKFITKTLANAGIAQDSTVIHNTGNETVAGVKTFTSATKAPNQIRRTIYKTTTVASSTIDFTLRDDGTPINAKRIKIMLVTPINTILTTTNASCLCRLNGIATGHWNVAPGSTNAAFYLGMWGASAGTVNAEITLLGAIANCKTGYFASTSTYASTDNNYNEYNMSVGNTISRITILSGSTFPIGTIISIEEQEEL